MHLRCIFISFIGLLNSCAAPQPQAFQAVPGAPPSNRAAPVLPRSDQGLAETWFIGTWRVQDSPCVLRLERDRTRSDTGPVLAEHCAPPWSGVTRWRRPGDESSLFELVTAENRNLWRAGAIQPTAIAGLSGEGELVRLYWAGNGSHPGWVQP